MSPADAGGSACETTALKAVGILQDMGGTCVKAMCKFDEMADVFYINIDVEFFGTALPNSWSPGPGYAIKIGLQDMNHVTRFQSQRETDKDVTAIANAKWHFTMEELLPPGTSEPMDPAEPFNLFVSRSNGDETYTGCTWLSVKREDTIKGVSQIRVGVAEKRTVLTIL